MGDTRSNINWSAVMTAGSGLLGSIFSGLFNRAAQRRQNENNWRVWDDEKAYNNQQRELQNQWNYDMWQNQNNYNENMYLKYGTPEAQRQQLVDAGYNPLTIGGQFQGAAPVQAESINSASNSGLNGPEMESAAFNFDVNSFANLMGAIAQVRKSDAETENILSKTPAETAVLWTEADLNEVNTKRENYYLTEVMPKIANNWKLQNVVLRLMRKEKRENIKLLKENIKYKEYVNSRLPEFTDAQIDQMTSNAYNAEKQGDYYEKMSGKVDADIKLIMEEIELYRSQETLNYARADESSANAALLGSQKTEQDFINDLNNKYGVEKVEKALRAADDMHTSMLIDQVMKVGRIKKDARGLIERAIRTANIKDKKEAEEFLKLVRDIKNGSIQGEQVPARWVDAVGSIAPWVLAGATLYVTKGKGKFGKSGKGFSSGFGETNMSLDPNSLQGVPLN